MHHEVIVKHHGCALFHKAFSVSNAASIWDVATLHIEPLGDVVPRMQSDSDPHNTASRFTESARETLNKVSLSTGI
jgi:hypothetical protein